MSAIATTNTAAAAAAAADTAAAAPLHQGAAASGAADAADAATAWLAHLADPAVIAGLLSSIATVLAVMIAAGLAYRHARNHSRRQHQTAIRVDRLRREIDALEHVWALLAYMTFGENADAIVRYRADRDNNLVYHLQLDNLRRFILTARPDAFYHQHAGLHLPKAVRDELFEYVGSVMGLYLRYEDVEADSGEPITLRKKALIDKLRGHYDTLNALLRKELDDRYRQMLEVE